MKLKCSFLTNESERTVSEIFQTIGFEEFDKQESLQAILLKNNKYTLYVQRGVLHILENND